MCVIVAEFSDAIYRSVDKIFPIGFSPSLSGTPGHSATYSLGGLVQVQQRCFAQPSSHSILKNVWWWPDQNNNNTLTSYTCRIYPRSTSNKIIIYVRWCGEWSGQASNAMAIRRTYNGDYTTATLLNRNSSINGDGNRTSCISPVISSHSAIPPAGTDTGSTPEQCACWYIDRGHNASGGNYVEYGPAFKNGTANRTVYTNRCSGDSNTSGRERLISQVILFEFSS